MAWAKDFMEYVNKWLSRDNNNCRSFTYGCALYDWVKEGRFDLDDLDLRYDMEQDIENESWANHDWVEWLSDEAIIEILDIAVLDEYWDRLSDECDEQDKQEIFDELDSYSSFETRDDYENTVQKLVEDSDNSNLNWRTVAEEYEDNNYLHIDEEETDEA